MDPTDDVRVTVSLLGRHDPARGRVVVHPTPATSSLQAFAHDLLGALGRAVNRLKAEQLTGTARTWQAAAAWMVTDQIGDVVVLRAERLSAGTWDRLVELCRHTGSRLLLVCHTRQIPAPLSAVLTGIEHQVLTDLPQALTELTCPPLAGLDQRPDSGDIAELPHLPSTGVAHFRAEAYRRLDAAAFARVDAVYRHGLEAACDWLSCPVPEQTWPANEHVQLFLTGLVHDSPTRAHTLARLRGAQAGFLANGLLLGVPSARDIMDVLSGPGLNALPLTGQIVEQIRAGVAHPMVAAAVATALFTGIAPQATSYATLGGMFRNPDALRVAWGPRITKAAPDPIRRTAPTFSTTAVFHVPAAARPLLRAAGNFALQQPTALRQRLLAPPAVTNERIEAAAGNSRVVLPPQPPALVATWQIRVTCAQIDAPPVHTPTPGMGEQPPMSRIFGQLSGPASAIRGRVEPPVNGRTDDHSHRRRPLTADTAADVLQLIHDHLNAVPRRDRHRGTAGRSWMLIRHQLACYPRDPDGNLTVLTPHPDVLFALGLSDRPAETVPERSFGRSPSG